MVQTEKVSLTVQKTPLWAWGFQLKRDSDKRVEIADLNDVSITGLDISVVLADTKAEVDQGKLTEQQYKHVAFDKWIPKMMVDSILEDYILIPKVARVRDCCYNIGQGCCVWKERCVDENAGWDHCPYKEMQNLTVCKNADTVKRHWLKEISTSDNSSITEATKE